ncbi:Acetate kinase [hydrothermal vent metagenome]|uniref:Acetate kinase n=1 Tax=hydrothermal vent metagenome TaxID=652676 RepID=A0A3B0TKZ0_9ZZZZ
MTCDPAILVLNCGSSSIKFALYMANRAGRADPESALSPLWRGAMTRIGLTDSRFRTTDGAGTLIADEKIPIPDHDAGLRLLLARFDRLTPRIGLAAVGHRVVHGGADCDCPVMVGPALLKRLRRLIPLAPLHQPHNLAGIEAVRATRPDLPQIACFDTAFHHGLPRMAQLTGLPRALTDAGIRRYGFHGLSYEYVMGELARRHGAGVAGERIIVAHLGNGASMAAIRDGRSIDTTMGFSALGGLVMGTRSGDLDPGIVLYLVTEKSMSPQQVSHLLYEKSGLLGLSGLSRNMAELLAEPQPAAAAEAVDYFCYQAVKHAGALAAILGGLDRLVFTGGIGANAPQIRARICESLGYLGVTIDRAGNEGGGSVISKRASGVVVEAFATDEEIVIARHVQALLAAQSPLAREA